MQKKRVFSVLFFVAVLVASAQSVAGRSIKLEEGQGLTQALQKAGCDLNQLAVVMDLNKISFEQLRSLPVGKPVQLPANCQAKPATTIVLKSKDIMAEDMKRSRGRLKLEAANLQPRVAAFEKVNADHAKAMAAVKKDLVSKDEQITALRAERDKFQKDSQGLTRLIRWFKWSVVISIIIATYLLFGFFVYRGRSRKLETVAKDDEDLINRLIPAQRVYTITDNWGGTITFDVEKVDVFNGDWRVQVKCPNCGVKDLTPGNLARHANEKCPALPDNPTKKERVVDLKQRR